MTLILPTDTLERIQRHAEQTPTEECCGLLLGRLEQGSGFAPRRIVVEAVAAQNEWSPDLADLRDADPSEVTETLSRRQRYWINPQFLMGIQRDGRERNLDIIGIYHSHIDHPAVPSECDRHLAWPSYSYVIVSVVHGKASDLQSWCLDDQHQFQPEPIQPEPIQPKPIQPESIPIAPLLVELPVP